MLTTFLVTLEQMARILLFFAIGFGIKKLNLLPEGSEKGISKLVALLFIPALLLHNNITEFNIAHIRNYALLILLGAALCFGIILLSHPLSDLLGKGDNSKRSIYLYSLCFANTGAVATPLAIALLGSAGLLRLNQFLFFTNIMIYAWGVELFLDVSRNNPIKRFFVHLINPTFICTLIGLTLGALGAKNWFPQICMNVLGDLSNCYVPLSLILAGYIVARYPLKDIFLHVENYWFLLLRLIVFPALVLLIVWLLKCSRDTAMLAVLTFAGSCGMNVIIFPSAYGKDCSVGVSLVLLSTISALFTVPLMVSFIDLLF